jgi:fatty acid synthase subunit alpha, fungi type
MDTLNRWQALTGSVNMQKIQDDIIKLWNVVKSQPEVSEEQKNRIKALYDGAVRSLHKAPNSRLRPGVPQSCRSSSQFLRPQISSITPVSTDKSIVWALSGTLFGMLVPGADLTLLM